MMTTKTKTKHEITVELDEKSAHKLFNAFETNHVGLSQWFAPFSICSIQSTGLGHLSNQTKGRRKDAQVRRDCLGLLERCLRNFTDGKEVGYGDVQDLYDTPDAFYRDCRKIKGQLEGVRGWLELLGIPLPPVEYKNGRLCIPVRRFAARATKLREERRRLAESLVNHKLSPGDEDLVPRTGTVYFGFGTTVLAVAEYLCKQPEKLSGFAISTSNIEILIRYYVTAAAQRTGDFLLTGVGEVNWDEGCVIPDGHGAPITTSIISFEAMNKLGQFFADTKDKLDAIRDALSRTKGRIILVGDKSKFCERYGRFEISLNDLDVSERFLFTNGEPPDGYKMQDGVEFVMPPGSTPSSQETRPPQPK